MLKSSLVLTTIAAVMFSSQIQAKPNAGNATERSPDEGLG